MLNGEEAWTKSGIIDLKHLSERIAKHEAPCVHITNKLQLQLEIFENVNGILFFIDAWRLSVTRHNQGVIIIIIIIIIIKHIFTG